MKTMKKGVLAVFAVLASVFGFIGSAAAALPVAISTELTAIETDALALADLVWPVLITLVGAVVMMKLFKRFSGKI